MRIVHFAAGWPPNTMRNGIVSSLGVLAPALRARGCEVEILALKGVDATGEDNVTWLNEAAPDRSLQLTRAIRARLTPNWYKFNAMPKRIVRALGGDSLRSADLFCIEESFGWCAPIARRVSMPVVIGLHGPWFLTGAAQKGGELDRIDRVRIDKEGEGLAAAAGVTAPSQFVLDAVRNHYGVELRQAAVIRNPVTPPAAEQRWDLQTADPNEILFIGRFDRLKGADVVLKAFAALAGERPALKLTFAGPHDRPFEDGGRQYGPEEYARSIMPPEAAARVSFLGHVPFDRLGELRRRAFVTVIASRFENLPSALLEAMAHGSPVVATDVGGIPEVARRDVTALLARPGDAAGFAQQMEKLLDNHALAAALGAAGRQHVETDYAPDHIARIAIDYYRTVLARRSRASH